MNTHVLHVMNVLHAVLIVLVKTDMMTKKKRITVNVKTHSMKMDPLTAHHVTSNVQHVTMLTVVKLVLETDLEPQNVKPVNMDSMMMVLVLTVYLVPINTINVKNVMPMNVQNVVKKTEILIHVNVQKDSLKSTESVKLVTTIVLTVLKLLPIVENVKESEQQLKKITVFVNAQLVIMKPLKEMQVVLHATGDVQLVKQHLTTVSLVSKEEITPQNVLVLMEPPIVEPQPHLLNAKNVTINV